MRPNKSNIPLAKRRQGSGNVAVTRISTQNGGVVPAGQTGDDGAVLKVQPLVLGRLALAKGADLGGLIGPVDLDHGVLGAGDLGALGLSLGGGVDALGEESESGGAAGEKGAEAEAEVAAPVLDKVAELVLVRLELAVGRVEIGAAGLGVDGGLAQDIGTDLAVLVGADKGDGEVLGRGL